MRQRLEQQAGAPGVVHHGQDAARPAGGGDGGDVLDLEAQRTGRFQNHHPGAVSELGGQLIGAQSGVVPAGGDAETGQQGVAEALGRPIDAVDRQHLVTALQYRQQGAGHGREAGGIEGGACGAFQAAQGLDQGGVRGQPPAAVGDLRAVVERLGVGQQHGRAALHRRAHGARQTLRRAAFVDKAGLFVHPRDMSVSRGPIKERCWCPCFSIAVGSPSPPGSPWR